MKELRKKTEKQGNRLQEAKKGGQVKRTTEHLRYFSFLMKSGKRFLTGNLLFFSKGVTFALSLLGIYIAETSALWVC